MVIQIWFESRCIHYPFPPDVSGGKPETFFDVLERARFLKC